jgi:PAS domain S-box-containing protein
VSGFDPSKLSAREKEILNLAVEGLTDQQIALRLEISPSTVNSYWVRIRGKVGYFSRTELAAKTLRLEAQLELDRLREEINACRQRAEAREHDEEEARHAQEYRAGLEAMPEAILVCDAEARILFTNSRLDRMFGYEPGELVGETVDRLTPAATRHRHRDQVTGYVTSDSPQPRVLGVDSAVYGQRKDGRLFRVVLLLGACRLDGGNVVSCVVRSHLSEAEVRRGEPVRLGGIPFGEPHPFVG